MASFLLSLVFFVMGVLFLFVAGWAIYGTYRLVQARGWGPKYLESGVEEPPMQISHLSEPLRSFALDTRLLRVGLEAPLEDIEEFVARDFDRNAQDIEAFDNMLMDISRQLTDWVLTAERLPVMERSRLEDLGLDIMHVRRALEREGWAFERRNLVREGLPSMDVRLRAIVEELRRIEEALQVSTNPYR